MLIIDQAVEALWTQSKGENLRRQWIY